MPKRQLESAMKANQIPLSDVGGTGIFGLIAESLSSSPRDCERREHRDGKLGAVERLMAEAAARDAFLVHRPMYTRYAPGLTSEAGHAITRSGMWSGLGFVGASTLAAGLLLLIDRGASALLALA